jgi:6-pyruvoyltetrahydropterin/6-carboxytetrahydropterin synthase
VIARLTATRRLQFCAGHFVAGHENKCASPHGHNYVVLITAEARVVSNPLDAVGRVVDFSVLKEKVGGWIETYWDHRFIVPLIDDATQEISELHYAFLTMIRALPGGKAYRFDGNPTAENMAKHLLLDVCPEVLKGTDVIVTKVVLWETENCYAEASL